MQNQNSPLSLNKKWLYVATFLNLLVIIACLVPIPPQAPQPFSRTDLVVHVTSYLIVTFFFLKSRLRPSSVLTALLLQGLLIELIQPSVGRHFEWLDCVANIGGVLGAYLLFKTVYRGQ